MLLHTLISLLFVVTSATAAALHPDRKLSPLDSMVAQEVCSPATVYSYLTVTVTHVPPTVTIAVPDYASISMSLASASTIDSIVVVENSINRPVGAPPNTIIPTFHHTINAPAVEATEVPNEGTSVVFVPNTKSPYTVAIGTVVESIIISPFGQPFASQSATQVAPFQNNNFTVPAGGWNETYTNTTTISPATGTGPTAGQSISSTLTLTTYVSTTTATTDTTMAPISSYNPPPPYSGPEYGDYSSYDEYSGNVKRQTCVMISALIGGHWASWCNNWDGSTTFPYTSWETTIIPGTIQEPVSDNHPTPAPSNPATGVPATASPTPSEEPSTCGQTGAFTVNFDNLPPQSVKNPADAGHPLIIDPFDHFFWSEGWSWMPPPSGPYSPHSGKQLAIFIPPAQNPAFPTTNLKDLPLGGFGAAQRSPIDAYWFNIKSAWVGCDNNTNDSSIDTCEFYAQGYEYSEQDNVNHPVGNAPAYFRQPICRSPTCQLQQIFFPPEYANWNLSTISFFAKVGGQLTAFYMDDIEFNWSNNSCEAGRLRATK